MVETAHPEFLCDITQRTDLHAWTIVYNYKLFEIHCQIFNILGAVHMIPLIPRVLPSETNISVHSYGVFHQGIIKVFTFNICINTRMKSTFASLFRNFENVKKYVYVCLKPKLHIPKTM